MRETDDLGSNRASNFGLETGRSDRTTELQPPPLPRQKTRVSGSGRRLLRWIAGVAFLALVSVAVWFWLSHQPANTGAASTRFDARMTTTVGVAVVKKGDIAIFLDGLGTVTPPATVDDFYPVQSISRNP